MKNNLLLLFFRERNGRVIFLRTRLRFDNSALEAEFERDYHNNALMTIRIAIILGIALYSAFGILDSLVAPLSKYRIWFIRFAVVVPSLISVFIMTYFDFFRKHMQIILSAVSLIAGLGIVVMLAITIEAEGSMFYYAGLMLVMMWAYTFVKLRFFYATICGWIIVIAYEVEAVIFQGLLSTPETLTIFINNNFFFIASNIIGMFACYLIELYTRKDFLMRREIASKKEELQVERNELKNRIDTMNYELEMARIIQQKFIPAEDPNEHISTLYKPMEAVGGDLLDFIRFKSDKKIGIFLSDVSGHGVPAALITSMIKSSILESRRFSSNPAMMLTHLNAVLGDQTEENFVTAFYAVYDMNTRTITYSNAGHHPPSIILSKKIVTLDHARSVPLAIMKNSDLATSGQVYTNSRAVLPGNSKLVLYTDGLVEAKNIYNRNIEFGDAINDRMLRLHGLNCRKFIDSLYGELIDFRGSEKFDDDICLICIDVD